MLVVLRVDLINMFERTHELEEREFRRSELEELGTLTASIEHDLKTPLGLINLHIEHMKRAYQSNLRIIADVERIEEATARIYAVTQIIPTLRATKEYYEQRTVKANIAEIVGRSVRAVKSEFDRPNIFFKSNCRDYLIKAYPPMLETAVVNVLKNSIEAIIEANREHGLVEISCRKRSAENVELVIVDNGCGIAPESIPRLTTLFSTKSNRKANSGIGLFIVARIIKLHGGTLVVQSEIGKSTSVSIALPFWNP